MGRNTTGLRPLAMAAGLPKGETKMFYIFKSIIDGLWGFWSGIFAPLPYGNPYIATVMLFVAVAVVCKLLSGRGTT